MFCLKFTFYAAVNVFYLEFFRITINVTAVPYHEKLSDRSSIEFHELADDVRSDVEHIYSSIPGQQSVNVLQFRSVSVVQRPK